MAEHVNGTSAPATKRARKSFKKKGDIIDLIDEVRELVSTTELALAAYQQGEDPEPKSIRMTLVVGMRKAGKASRKLQALFSINNLEIGNV